MNLTFIWINLFCNRTISWSETCVLHGQEFNQRPDCGSQSSHHPVSEWTTPSLPCPLFSSSPGPRLIPHACSHPQGLCTCSSFLLWISPPPRSSSWFPYHLLEDSPQGLCMASPSDTLYYDDTFFSSSYLLLHRCAVCLFRSLSSFCEITAPEDRDLALMDIPLT